MAAPNVGKNSTPSIIFSVDVEDWAQSTLDHDLPIGEHCAENVRRLLDLIAGTPGATGTFFVLGKFAEKHPDAVRAINRAGHEIASHGYGHVQVDRLTPAEFRDDIRRSRRLLADIVGVDVTGYRAPVFSIGSRNLWALDVLHDEGFRYDSSIFPIAGRRYGIPNWPGESRIVRLAGGAGLTEFPLTATSFVGRAIPISGGGYARLLPGRLLVGLFHRESSRRSDWPVFYCHPHEIDPGEFGRTSPPPPWGSRRLPIRLRLHQGLGRGGFAAKLRRLMTDFRFRSFADAMRYARPSREVRASEFACTASVSVRGSIMADPATAAQPAGPAPAHAPAVR